MRGAVLARLRGVPLFRKVEALLWPHHPPIANNQTDCGSTGRLDFKVRLLPQHLGIKTSIDLLLVGWVTVGLKRSDQSAQPRRENNQITGTLSGAVSVGDACGHEYCRPWANSFASVGITKSQLAFKDVPRFVIGMMDMEDCRATAAPLMDAK